MSNITEEIEKLSGIMSKLGEAHNMLAKTSLSKEEYQPISNLLASAKVELFKFYNGHKAALPVKILSEKEFNTIISTQLFNNIRSSQFKKGMYAGYLETVSKEYVSVNERNDNIPADFKQVTGHNSPKEMIAYEKGREDEQEVIMKWIEQWDGSSNSVMGALLKKKFNERKDNVESDAAEFANWIINNRYIFDFKKIKYVAAWNNYQELTTEELYKIFQESQPQQKEVDGYDDEMPPL